MDNKDKFMEYARRRLKQKEYKRRALINDLDSVKYAAIEKNMRRKIGQM